MKFSEFMNEKSIAEFVAAIKQKAQQEGSKFDSKSVKDWIMNRNAEVDAWVQKYIGAKTYEYYDKKARLLEKLLFVIGYSGGTNASGVDLTKNYD
jgi:hypothetical protein